MWSILAIREYAFQKNLSLAKDTGIQSYVYIGVKKLKKITDVFLT